MADLVAGLPRPDVGADGRVSDPLCLVDLDAPLEDGLVEPVLRALADRSIVTVGVARGPLGPAQDRASAALDVTLSAHPVEGVEHVLPVQDLDAGLAVLDEEVRRSPRAALVLTALLRQTALLPVPEALAAEAAAYSTLLAGPEFARWLSARRRRERPSAESPDRVQLELEPDRLHVRLARPDRRNALDAAMRRALVDALDVALLEDGLAVVLSGRGPVFSSGGDLDEFGSAADPATAWVVRTAESPARSLARLATRLEVRVHGRCAGAGVELPAFAGRVVADPATTFRLPETAMGLLPGAGGTVSLVRRIGRWRTAWLGLSGAELDTRTAVRWGLVDAVEPVGDRD